MTYKTDFIFDNKFDLAKYVASYHQNIIGNGISPIKLQKSLYFLYAYWTKIFSSSEPQLGEDSSMNLTSDRLFKSNFRAWKYGPVEQDIYNDAKTGIKAFNDDEAKEFMSSTPNIVLSFIDDLLDDIFTTNDFALVDLSHEDSCWANNYDSSDRFSDKEISHQEIVSVYAN